MKSAIRRLVKKTGYEINKTPKNDTSLYYDLYPEDSILNKRFYNIGAGGFYHPFWTNVDYDSEWYAFNRQYTLKGIQYNLMALEPLPIDTGMAEVVYSSHTVEHITNAAAQNVFDEAYRILKPNGYLRVTTPNINLEYRAFRENDRNYFFWIDTYSIEANWKRAKYVMPLNKASVEQIFLAHFASSASTLHSDGAPERIDDAELHRIFDTMEYEEALDHCIAKCPLEIQKKYPGNHLNWWNFEKMSSMMKKAGFSKIYNSGYGQSFCPVLREVSLFDNTHPKISLYVEAVK